MKLCLLLISFTSFFGHIIWAKECYHFLKPQFEIVQTPIQTDHAGNEYLNWSQAYGDTEEFYFIADLNEFGELKFSVKLIDYETNQRSSMKGSEYFAQTISTLKKHKIKKIYGHWFDDSDNFKQFYEAFKKGLSLEDAARSTWTGQNAVKHGFTKVLSVTFHKVKHDSQDVIVAIFTKE